MVRSPCVRHGHSGASCLPIRCRRRPAVLMVNESLGRQAAVVRARRRGRTIISAASTGRHADASRSCDPFGTRLSACLRYVLFTQRAGQDNRRRGSGHEPGSGMRMVGPAGLEPATAVMSRDASLRNPRNIDISCRPCSVYHRSFTGFLWLSCGSFTFRPNHQQHLRYGRSAARILARMDTVFVQVTCWNECRLLAGTSAGYLLERVVLSSNILRHRTASLGGLAPHLIFAE